MTPAHTKELRLADWLHGEASYRLTSARPVDGHVRQVGVDGYQLAEIHADAHTSRRDPPRSSADPPRYMLALQVAGTMSLRTDDAAFDLRPGDLGVYHSSRTAEVVSRSGHHSFCLIVPEEYLGVPRRRLLAAEGHRIPADRGLAPALAPLVLGLPDLLPRIPAAQAVRALQALADLMAALLTTESDLITGAEAEPRRDLLDRMLRFVDRNAGNPGLDVRTLAAAHFVSVRHVHDLFHDVGETPAGRIRSLRVEGARRDLADPALSRTPIAAISARWGFTSASRFTKTFAASTGMTPATYRQASVGRG